MSDNIENIQDTNDVVDTSDELSLINTTIKKNSIYITFSGKVKSTSDLNEVQHKAFDIIAEKLTSIIVDPFDPDLHSAHLDLVQYPGQELLNDKHHKLIKFSIPDLTNYGKIKLGGENNYIINDLIDKGGYGQVYKARDLNTNKDVALKYMDKSNLWEIYICDQIRSRIESNTAKLGLLGEKFSAIIAKNVVILGSEFSQYGSILSIYNSFIEVTGQLFDEVLVMYFASEICHIVEELHKIEIIHGDIKPDNILLMSLPTIGKKNYPSLRLIDYGMSIDMTLVGPAKFSTRVFTKGFVCPEMIEGACWTYETDLFCVCSSVYVLLCGKLLEFENKSDKWKLKQKLPQHLNQHIWNHFFDSLLNINVSTMDTILKELRNDFLGETMCRQEELKTQFRELSNFLQTNINK